MLLVVPLRLYIQAQAYSIQLPLYGAMHAQTSPNPVHNFGFCLCLKVTHIRRATLKVVDNNVINWGIVVVPTESTTKSVCKRG